ncbi:fungal-specific transcription factor domain-containing protein [Annulohypoxylon truncatum]|uniref:fungal-specific transcription factor domain-containing protein n=1 Tax=Annulohypoxylon truncatum TaxID=327061 RepID=UPI002007DEA3|nr:fungal-specific transcription factor domain-containing protein [Annulohypoxylon truncatum]KAI1204594.1 fungal-specific transcription factor domain-containing protein [Annulohypoxylon truncatum]
MKMPFSRTRTGCFTCREDGYKCDEQKPFCGRCTRLGKTCKGYGVRLKWQTPQSTPKSKASKSKRQQRTRSNDKTVTAPLTPITPSTPSTPSSESRSSFISLDPSCIVPNDVSPINRYLLNHWSSTLSTMVSMVSAPRNPFLIHLTPMISHSTALRSVLCSIAASHLAILRHEDSLQTLATRYRLVGVSSLRQTIQTDNPELSLATILMLQVSDRLFTMDSGVDHLSGAKAIINQGGIVMRNSSSASFLLSLCSYHDILASVSRGTSPVFEFDGRFPMEGMESMNELTSVLQLVGQISRMRDQEHDDIDARGREIEEILSALDESGDALGDVGHTVQAYKHAAFIYLYRVWHNQGAPHPRALRHAKSCLDHLNLVPVTSPLVSAQVWPLWTAGCESIDKNQRQFVRDRVEAMYEARHLPSLRRIEQDIEEVWKIKDEQRNLIGVDNVDCIKVILRNRQREADLT